jgi:O-antigen/teichoic acid export membrane protein
MPVTQLVKDAFKNRAGKTVLLYVFSNFFSKGIAFILLPVFTNPKFLTPADNGVLSIFASTLLLISPFIALGMRHSVSADYFNKPKKDFDKAFTSNFLIAGLLAVVWCIILLLAQNTLQQKFQFPGFFVFLIPALVFLTFCSDQLFTLLKLKEQPKKYALYAAIKTVIEFGVSLLLIISLYYGWKGRVWGITASLIVTALLSLLYYVKTKQFSRSFSIKHVGDEVKYGIPILVFQLCVFILGPTNKFFLVAFNADAYQLGIYAVASIFGTAIGTVSQSVLLYSQNKLYAVLSTGTATTADVKKLFFSHFKIVIAGAILCTGVIAFLYYFVINKIYLPGLPLFFVCALSSLIWSVSDYLLLLLLFYKAKKRIFLLSLISIICSVTAGTLLVKYYLIWGDAVAGVVNTLLFGIILLFFIKSLPVFKK